MFCRRLRWVLLFFALCSSSSISYAQSSERARARAAADEGAQAFDAGRYTDAINSFERAESLFHAPPHLLFIARARAKLGQLLRARAIYRKIVHETLGPASPPPFRQAQAEASEELADLAKRVPRLKVSINSDSRIVRVSVDGARLDPALIGEDMAVDPGDHVVVASTDGKTRSKRVSLGEGANQNVLFDFNVSSNSASSSANGLRAGSIVAFGVGVLGLAGGAIFTMESSKKHDQADALCENGCPVAKKDEIEGLYGDSRRFQTMAAVSFAAGGVGVVTGTTLLILSGSSSSKEERASAIRPYVGIGSAGVRGRF